jgi:hypothetical protein
MADQSPDPWRILWRFATGNAMLGALLLILAASIALTAWIPQRPSPSSDVAYARWLSQTQARFGGATSLMQTLSLFNIVPSLGFRTLLALLSGCVLLRMVEGLDQLRKHRAIEEPNGAWEKLSCPEFEKLVGRLSRRRYRVLDDSAFLQVDRWPWSGLLPLMAHLGALLLLVSLLLSHLLGWQVEGLILQGGDKRALPGSDSWVSLAEDGSGTRHSPGVVTFIEESGPGVQVSAVDQDGELLPILLASDADPSTSLKAALTGDTYFAIPQAQLIVRLTPRSEEPYTRTDVQIYSSPAGEIISETVTDKGGQAVFDVGDVTLMFDPAPYARVMATRNPGRLPAGLGLVMLMLGLEGSLMWSECRFWLREDESSVEIAGSFPSWIQAQEKGL